MVSQRVAALLLVMAVPSAGWACGGGAADQPAPPATFVPVPAGSPATGPGSQVGTPGGPAAMVTDMATGWPITLQVGQEVMVRLSADRQGGMSWKPAGSTDVLSAPGEPVFEPAVAAAPSGTEVYRLKALKPGQATLVFEYRKTLDAAAPPARTVSYEVTVR